MQKYGFLFNSGAQPDMSGDSSNNPGIFEDSGIVWTILPVNSLNPKRAKSSVFKIIALGLACLFLLACTPTAIPTPEPSAGSCTLNLPASASNEEAIKQVLNAEGDLVVKQDISPLMQLWAASSQVVNAKNTPDDPSDDQFWLDKDAIRNRYVRTVFPGAPATAAPADLSITITEMVTGTSAVVTATTQIGNEVSPAGDRWLLVQKNDCWLIQSLIFNLETQKEE